MFQVFDKSPHGSRVPDGSSVVLPQQVWIVWGDGSCGYSVAEFDTYTRHQTPVLALVGNDAGWTQILREQVTILGTEVACKLAVTISA